MKNTDLTPLLANDQEFEKLALQVSDKYKCSWDDELHDSYGIYVKQLQERSREVRSIRCKAELLVKEVEALKLNDQIRTAGNLCREAERV